MIEGLDKLVWQLQDIRKNRNMSMKRLAELSGVNESTISNYENLICSPSMENLVEISKALGIKLYWKEK